MECVGCGSPSVYTWYGPWCDSCGGVVARNGVLIFRHVATADGKGGRIAIIFDKSTNDYAFIHPNRRNSRSGMRDKDMGEFRTSPFVTLRGTLDAMVAIAQPIAKGDGPENPVLSAAPSSTDEERALLGV